MDRTLLRRTALTLAAAALAACGRGEAAPADQTDPATPPAATIAAAAELAPMPPASDTNRVVVYKTPTCGCCAKWVDHMKGAGFDVEVHDLADVQPVKSQHGLPGDLASCHTALIGGYVVEGHVPAADIRRLLREHPQVAGIAAPGMPMGSPGMEASHADPYDVIAFTKDGQQSIFATH